MDQLGNRTAREGYDFCLCGCKYWENDRCIDCGLHVESVAHVLMTVDVEGRN